MGKLIEQAGIEFHDHGKGIPIVFVHGIQGTLQNWNAVTERLKPEYRVITLNLRGRGASPAPLEAAEYSLDAFSSDLKSVTDHVGDKFILVGYSMGVLVALDYIKRHGCTDLRGLVLVSGSACVGNEAVWFHQSDLASIAQEAEQRAKALGLTETATSLAVAASWQQVKQADYRDILPLISVPTLVLHGAQDDQCPLSHGRLLADQIPEAQFSQWAGAGHNMMGHDPGRLAKMIAGFISKDRT